MIHFNADRLDLRNGVIFTDSDRPDDRSLDKPVIDNATHEMKSELGQGFQPGPSSNHDKDHCLCAWLRNTLSPHDSHGPARRPGFPFLSLTERTAVHSFASHPEWALGYGEPRM